MPLNRLERMRASLPQGYQFGDATGLWLSAEASELSRTFPLLTTYPDHDPEVSPIEVERYPWQAYHKHCDRAGHYERPEGRRCFCGMYEATLRGYQVCRT